jgi:hypothetical protein
LRTAAFVYGSAAEAGFLFRAHPSSRFQVLGPPDIDPALCENTIAAIRAHAAGIAALVRFLDSEADEGRLWAVAAPTRGRAQ